MILLFAAFLPCLVWDGSRTNAALEKAHIDHICILKGHATSAGAELSIPTETIDVAQVINIAAPSITFRGDVASPSRTRWITLNGWRYLRNHGATFYVAADPAKAPLAAAEAFSYDVNAAIDVSKGSIDSLGRMFHFLRNVGETHLPPMVNFGYIDDGSPESAEFMNLLVRRNLLFQVEAGPDRRFAVNVKIGDPQYPRAEASNPKLLTEKVRAQVTDLKRVVRVYGTDEVVVRLLGDGKSARLYLINYGGAQYPVPGLRVRVLGEYRSQSAVQFGSDVNLQDVLVSDGATEFTIPKLTLFAVIDLKR